MLSRVKRSVLGGIALAALTVLVTPASAFAGTDGTATLTGGGAPSMTAPNTVQFAATLTGQAQTVTADPQSIDVVDNSGTYAGWNITLSATTFTNGSYTLPADAVADTGASGACDLAASCTLGDNAAITYPVVINAAPSNPDSVKIQTADVSTGMSGQTWQHVMSLLVPATAHAGVYSSTWVYSLTSGP